MLQALQPRVVCRQLSMRHGFLWPLISSVQVVLRLASVLGAHTGHGQRQLLPWNIWLGILALTAVLFQPLDRGLGAVGPEACQVVQFKVTISLSTDLRTWFPGGERKWGPQTQVWREHCGDRGQGVWLPTVQTVLPPFSQMEMDVPLGAS